MNTEHDERQAEAGMTTPMTSVTPPAEPAWKRPPAPIEEPEPSAEAEEDEPSDETSDETSEELSEDPFAAWPQAESAEVIEDVPDTEPVQHVAGEIDVPDGYTVLEGTPSGHGARWLSSSPATTAASRTVCSRSRSTRSGRPACSRR
jgi:hypothetical protein